MRKRRSMPNVVQNLKESGQGTDDRRDRADDSLYPTLLGFATVALLACLYFSQLRILGELREIVQALRR